MSEIDDERKLYEEYAMVDALGERRFARGERAWWVPKNAVRPDHDAQIAVTVLRTGKVWATVIVAMNGSGHWYTQRARLNDMRLRTEYLAVDVIADKGIMVCDCGNIMDRDLNAAMNLKNNAASSAVPACGEEGSGSDRKIKVKPASAKQEVEV